MVRIIEKISAIKLISRSNNELRIASKDPVSGFRYHKILHFSGRKFIE
jgi:hypothetical protein